MSGGGPGQPGVLFDFSIIDAGRRSRLLSFLQLVVSSYEARQEELLQENKGLSAALAHLQSDYRTLANKQAAAQQLQAAAVRQVVEDEHLQDVLRISDAGQVQADLSAKMAAMKTKIESVYDGPMQQVQSKLLVHM